MRLLEATLLNGATIRYTPLVEIPQEVTRLAEVIHSWSFVTVTHPGQNASPLPVGERWFDALDWFTRGEIMLIILQEEGVPCQTR